MRDGPRTRGGHGVVTPRSFGGGFAAASVLLGYLAVVVWTLGFRPRAGWALAALLALNALTFLVYWLDKRAARRGGPRFRERTLHLWSLAGGWPAAWVSQRVLRHKRAKASFLKFYWLTVALHWAALLAWASWQAGGLPVPPGPAAL